MTPRVRLYACIAAANNGTTIPRVMGASRNARDCKARCEVIRQLYDDGLGVTAIGRLVGRDHSTVLHALGRKSGPRKPPKPVIRREPSFTAPAVDRHAQARPLVTEAEIAVAERIAARPPIVPCFRCGARYCVGHR